jgi:hypothetical protein
MLSMLSRSLVRADSETGPLDRVLGIP